MSTGVTKTIPGTHKISTGHHADQYQAEIAASARDVLGGNGMLLDYRMMEHMAEIEGVYTYEGTNDVNTLIVGQEITGHRAFAPRPTAAQ